MSRYECFGHHDDCCDTDCVKYDSCMESTSISHYSANIRSQEIVDMAMITCGIDKLKLIRNDNLIGPPTNTELMNKINEIIDKFDEIARRR